MAKQVTLTGKESEFSGIVLKAAPRGDLGGVKSLIKQNPKWVHQVVPHGCTMLWEAAYKGRLPVVEHWMECGTELDQPGCYYTPMLAEVAPKTAALLKAHFFVAQALDERGATVDFHDACYLGDKRYVRSSMTVNRSIALSKKTRSSDPSAAAPIFYAVADEQPEILKLLLKAGGKTQARNGLLLRSAA